MGEVAEVMVCVRGLESHHSDWGGVLRHQLDLLIILSPRVSWGVPVCLQKLWDADGREMGHGLAVTV